MRVCSDPAAQLLAREVTFNSPQGQLQAQFTASISGNVLNVTAVAQGNVAAGLQLAGAGIPANTYITGGAITAHVPGTIEVAGGGTPTGSGLPANNPSNPSTGVVTGQSGAINTGNSGSSGNQVLTGTGGIGTYLLSQVVGTVASEAMTAAPAQANTGPSVQVNQNPVGGVPITGAPLSPGAVGPVAFALPYYPANATNQLNTGVNSPAVPFPAAGVEQINLGNSIINRAFPQWSGGGEAGLVQGAPR